MKARNRILQLQCDFKHTDNPFDYGLSPENVVNFMQYAGKRIHDEDHNIYTVYGIPKRKKSKRGMDIKTKEHLAEITDSDFDFDVDI